MQRGVFWILALLVATSFALPRERRDENSSSSKSQSVGSNSNKQSSSNENEGNGDEDQQEGAEEGHKDGLKYNEEMKEGDMLIDEEQLRRIKQIQLGKGFRNAMNDVSKRWPGGVVAYVVDPAYEQWEKDTILDAMETIKNDTAYNGAPCITFKERTTEANYVNVQSLGGCYSRVGQSGGGQPLSLGPGCVRKGTAMHEFLHTLGFWHEQSRSDRDYYISVNWTNIKDGHSSNFDKFCDTCINHQGLPYDYDSIMHYGAYSFAKDYSFPTIIAKQAVSGYMGQRSYLSVQDVNELRSLYGCRGSYTVSYVLPATTAPPTTTIAPQIDGVLERQWGCDFDSGMCSFINDSSMPMWIRQSGPTPSSRTGPTVDHTTGAAGHYMFTEASSNYGIEYRMISNKFDKYDTCIDFWYHMYSENEDEGDRHVGTLQLFSRSSGKDILLWELSSSQGSDWINGRAQVTVADHIPGKKWKLLIKGSILQSYKSDMAVDDITLFKGTCP